MRARESELDDVRALCTASEARVHNLQQRLQLSGGELRRAEEAARGAQRQARSLKQRLDESEAAAAGLRDALASLDSAKDDAQVRGLFQESFFCACLQMLGFRNSRRRARLIALSAR